MIQLVDRLSVSEGRSQVSSSNKALRLSKFGVPNPVTGSHPLVAWKPAEHPPSLLLPVVTSKPNDFVDAYNRGLMNPTVGFPLATRSSLINDTSPANVGHEAEVPDRVPVSMPPEKTVKQVPIADTSGVALPLLLKRLEKGK